MRLKACPFCKGDAEVKYYTESNISGRNILYVAATCNNCGSVGERILYDSIILVPCRDVQEYVEEVYEKYKQIKCNKAIEAWNRRA